MQTIFWIIFFITFPILIMYLCQKYSFLDSIGAVVLCYGAGIIIGNLGIFPDEIFKTQDMFLTLTIPVALPLLFFSVDMKSWFRLAGKSLISFFSALFAVLVSTSVALYIFHDYTEEAWKISGMLIGCYTGGTPNLASIGTALSVDPNSYVAVHASDVFISAIYLLIAMTILPKILKKILPPFKNIEQSAIAETKVGFETNFNGFTPDKIKPLCIAFGLSLVIFAIGGGLTLIVPKDISMVVAILTITTLGVASSFIPKIRNTDYTFQLGYFIILIFSLVVSSMADISNLISTAPVMIGFVLITIILTAIIHILFSFVFRVDADTHIITSVALVLSPPFVPMVAAALKNKEIVVSGVLIGIFGWIIGNYLGISFSYILKSIFY